MHGSASFRSPIVSVSLCSAVYPLIAASLVERTADDFSPVRYLMALSLAALVVVLLMPEMKGRDLRV